MPQVPRRTFLHTLAAVAAAPAILSARSGAARLPIAFSTLGCPKWDWKAVLRQAADLGYAAVELRGIQGDMDLPQRPELTGSRLAESLKDLAALDLKVSDLGSSARMHESDPGVRAAQLDEGRRFIDLAQAMGVPCVRVFGNNFPPGEPRASVVERVVAGLRTLGEHAKGSGVTVILESHGDFTDAASLLEVLEGVSLPAVALLWDAHHTVVAGKEAPADTFRKVGRYVRHTHLKDSKAEGAERRYVLTGTGEVPVKETVRVLVAGGYRGYYCFEWEKVWHPEIEEPEVAFPHYARTMRGYLAEAGWNSEA
jgi:sugar phosphate isomerase/epimerase